MASFNRTKLLAWNLRQPLVKRIPLGEIGERIDGMKANIRGRRLLASILAEPAIKEKVKQIYTTPDASEWANKG